MIKKGLWVFCGFLIACSPNHKDMLSPNNDDKTGVLYFGDSRQDITQDDPVAKLADATALLIEEHKVTVDQTTSSWILKTIQLKKQYPLCSDENFLNQPTVGFCTGVLIFNNRVLTAGHCLTSKDFCQKTKIVFGWTLEKSQRRTQPLREVYSCKQVVIQVNQQHKGQDYAIFELDRSVTEVIPVKIAADTTHKKGDTLLSLSYPLGLPLKKDNAKVLEDIFERNQFKVEVDTFSGSSGSPLFNLQGELVGILSSGMEDLLEDDIYRIQKDGGCLNFNRCPEGTCFGESFFKAPRIDL